MINRLPQLGENMNSMTFHDLSVFDHFFFDLDGTLADSKADVLGSIEQAYRSLGFGYDKSRLKIGPLLPEIIASISPQLDENQRTLAATTFRAMYAAGKYRNTRLFEGVAEFLDKLQAAGKTLYVATNKPKAATYEVLEKLGIKDRFLFIGTPDCSGEHLPKAEVLKMMVSMFGLDTRKCVMVGDTVADMEAGRLAGMRTLGFLSGYGDESFRECGADGYFVSYRELLS